MDGWSMDMLEKWSVGFMLSLIPFIHYSSARSSEKSELLGLIGVLREFHEGLLRELKQRGDGSGLPALLQCLHDAGEETAAIDAVDFGAMKVAGWKSKMTHQRAELVVDHAGKNNA